MNSTEILIRMMERTEDEDEKKACMEAVHALQEVLMLRKKIKRSVQVPCRVGEKLYSVIGEGVQEYVIDGYRIDKNEIFLTSDNLFFKASRIGEYFFFSESVAKMKYNTMYQGKKTG